MEDEKKELEKDKKTTKKRTTSKTKKTTSDKPKRVYRRKTLANETSSTEENSVIEELTFKDELTTNVTFNLLEVIIIILITGVVVSIISGLIVYNNYNKIKDIENLSKENQTITQKELDEFTENYNLILNEYVEDVDKKELLDAAISGMYYYLGDEHTGYIDANNTNTLSDQLQGEYEGIGIEIITFRTNEKQETIVNRVFKDSPADKAGVKAGDILSKLDGVDLSEKDASYIGDYIKNGNKTKFEIVVIRDKKEITLTINRDHVIIDSVETKVFDKKTGYMKVSTFSSVTTKQIKDALDSFDKNVKNLIVDLRDNTGGLLTTAQEVCDLFVEKGKNIYQVQDKNNNITEFKAKSGVYKKFDKIVVIINGDSASASEILALALKESAGAKIVGTASYGKGTIQDTKYLASGAMVKYTTSHWLSPNGNSIDKVGIKPDIEEKDEDKQLEKAKKAVK